MLESAKRKGSSFFTFLEKWTELDIKYYFRGGAILFTTQAFIVLSGLLLSIGFARLTSKELYGQFQFVLAAIGTLSVLSLPGVNTAVQLGAANDKDGTYWQGLRLKLKWSFLGILGLIVTAIYFYNKHNPRYDQLWPIFLIAIPFFVILYSFDINHPYFQGRKKFEWSCGFQLITEAGSALVALGALLFTHSLFIVITCYLAMQAFGDSLTFLFLRKRLRNNKTDPDFFSYSAHLTAINFISYIKGNFDDLIVTYFLGFEATAVYVIGSALPEQLYAVAKNVSFVLFPKFAEQERTSIYSAVRKHAIKLTVFFIAVAVGGIIIAPFIIPFFFSAQYQSAVPIAQLLLLASIPRALAYVLTRVQEAHKEKKKLYSINAFYAGTEIALILFFVAFKGYGMYGLIGAKAMANIVYFITSWVMLR